jgi:hypothetical protein
MTAGPLCSGFRQLGRPSVAFRWAPIASPRTAEEESLGAKRLTAARASDAFGFSQCELFYTVPSRQIVP